MLTIGQRVEEVCHFPLIVFYRRETVDVTSILAGQVLCRLVEAEHSCRLFLGALEVTAILDHKSTYQGLQLVDGVFSFNCNQDRMGLILVLPIFLLEFLLPHQVQIELVCQIAEH